MSLYLKYLILLLVVSSCDFSYSQKTISKCKGYFDPSCKTKFVVGENIHFVLSFYHDAVEEINRNAFFFTLGEFKSYDYNKYSKEKKDLNYITLKDTTEVSNLKHILIYTPSINALKSNLDGGDYCPEIKGIESNDYPWLISVGYYSIDVIYYFSELYNNPLKFRIFFEVVDFPDTDYSNDYSKFLTCLKNELQASKQWYYIFSKYGESDSHKNGLLSYVYSLKSKYINEALTILIFPRDLKLAKEFDFRKEVVEYVLSSVLKRSLQLNDVFLMMFFDTYMDFIFHQVDISYLDNLLKSLRGSHSHISEKIIQYAKKTHGITSLINYAAQNK